MWALRRASSSLKKQGLRVGVSRIGPATSESPTSLYNSEYSGASLLRSDGHLSWGFPISINDSPILDMGFRSFLSQVDTKTSEEDNAGLEDGFSELESPNTAEAINESNLEDENDGLISEPELSGDELNHGDDLDSSQFDPEGSDSETSVNQKRPQRRISSALVKAIVSAPNLTVNKVMDKWVEDGKELTRQEISQAVLSLRKQRMYGKALQLLEWVNATKTIEFAERDYASLVDLIAKTRGLQKAASYIETIPKSSRGEIVYRTLLANCVLSFNPRKSEEVFDRMKNLGFPLTSFTCNQMLLLYKRVDKKKIADILLLMERENVKPTLFTYKILIDAKGQTNDITGMDKIVETMKAEGIEPDLRTKAAIARHYVFGGLKDKAEAALKEMEGNDVEANRQAYSYLLPLFAALGKADDVRRIWKSCESNPRQEECLAAIEAWGKLKNIEEAEAVFEKMLNKWNKLSTKHYLALLKAYGAQKMLAKGKDLVKRMADSGCHIGPRTWDALIKLYIQAGEVEKADVILQKASEQKQSRPLFSSYLALLDQYAERGDIHNSEKMFHRMRQAGYVSSVRHFQSLVRAYINAKVPAYGIEERMKADNIVPNKQMSRLLSQVDAFRKTPVSDLLD